MTSRFVRILTALVIGTCVPVASGEIIATGAPQDGGSWSQGWSVGDTTTTFDTIAIRIFSSGDTFTATPISGFSNLFWSVVSVSNTLVVLSGPAVNVLSFTQHLEGTVAVEGANLATTWAVFHDSGQTQNFTADLDRGTFGGDGFNLFDMNGDLTEWWLATPSDRWDPETLQQAMLPLPAPLAMAGVGLLGVILGRKRLQRTAVG